MCIWHIIRRRLVQKQTQTLKHNYPSVTANRLGKKKEKRKKEKGSLLCQKQTRQRFQTKSSEQQQPQMFVVLDKVGRSNDKSLSFTTRPKGEAHSLASRTLLKVCEPPLVWRGRPFAARLRSQVLTLLWEIMATICHKGHNYQHVRCEVWGLRSPPHPGSNWHMVTGTDQMHAGGDTVMAISQARLTDGGTGARGRTAACTQTGSRVQ